MNPYPMMGYSMIQAFAIAATRAGSVDGPAVIHALDNFKNEPLLVGPTTYTSTTHFNTQRPMAVEKTTNGQVEFVGLVTPTFVPPPQY